MPICCSVPRCRTFKNKSEQVSIHRCPADEKWRDKWINVFRSIGKSMPKHTFVCSKHFVESDFLVSSVQKKRLKRGAVPTQNLPLTDKRKINHSLRERYRIKPVVSVRKSNEEECFSEEEVYLIPLIEDQKKTFGVNTGTQTEETCSISTQTEVEHKNI